MADTEQEAQWRKQFEANGREAVLIYCRDGSISGQQRNFAYRWLKEIDDAREARDEAGHWYSKNTYRVAVVLGVATLIVAAATLIVSIIGLR